MSRLGTVLTCALICGPALGQYRDFESLTAEELDALDPAVLAYVPVPLLLDKVADEDPEMAAEIAPIFEFATWFALRELFYVGDPSNIRGRSVSQAVEKFQSDIGATPTGELTFGQLLNLAARAARRREIGVTANASAEVEFDTNYAMTQGTWKDTDQSVSAQSLNLAEVQCYQSRQICIVVQSSLAMPNLQGALTDVANEQQYLLSLDATVFNVISWSDQEIHAENTFTRPADQICVHKHITLSSSPNEAHLSTGRDDSDECAEDLLDDHTLADIQPDRDFVLVNSEAAMSEFWRRRALEGFGAISSEALRSGVFDYLIDALRRDRR